MATSLRGLTASFVGLLGVSSFIASLSLLEPDLNGKQDGIGTNRKDITVDLGACF